MDTRERRSSIFIQYDIPKQMNLLAYLFVGYSAMGFLFSLYQLITNSSLAGFIMMMIFLASLIANIIGTYILLRQTKDTEKIRGVNVLVRTFILTMFAWGVIITGMGLYSFIAIMLFTGIIWVVYVPDNGKILDSLAEGGGLALILGIISSYITPFWKYSYSATSTPWIIGFAWAILVAILVVEVIILLEKFPALPLQMKILSVFTGLALLIIGSLAAGVMISQKNITLKNYEDVVSSAANNSANDLKDFFITTAESLRVESEGLTYYNYLRLPYPIYATTDVQENVDLMISNFSSRDIFRDHIFSVSLFDNEGLQLKNIGPGQDTSPSEYLGDFNDLLIGDYISSPKITQNGNQIIFFSTPIENTEGEVIGVIVLTYDLNILQQIVEMNNNMVGEGTFGVLYNQDYIIYANGSDPQTVMRPLADLTGLRFEEIKQNLGLPNADDQSSLGQTEEMTALKEAMLQGGTVISTTNIADENQTYLAALVPMQVNAEDWVYVYYLPESIYAGSITSMLNVINVGFLVLMALVVYVGVLSSRFMVNPLKKLSASANQVAEGNLQARAEIRSRDEFGDMAVSFNQMAGQLEKLVENMEDEVRARTVLLNKRNTELQAAAQIAHEVSMETKVEEVVRLALELMSGRLDLKYVNAYLINESRTEATLYATNVEGESSRALSYSVPINNTSLIGQTFLSGIYQIVPEERVISISPDIHSQVLIPVRIGGEVLGILDIQSPEVNRFSESDIIHLQLITDQISNSIQKIQVLEERETAIKELQTTYRMATREAWQSYTLGVARTEGYSFKENRIEKVKVSEGYLAEVWETGRTMVDTSDNEDGNSSVLMVPVKSHGEVVSVLQMTFLGDEIPEHTLDLIQNVAERLSTILETSRLLDTAQRQTRLEGISTQIAGRIRERLDIDAVMRTAIQEVGDIFNLPEIEIRMGILDEVEDLPEEDDSLPEEQEENAAE